MVDRQTHEEAVLIIEIIGKIRPLLHGAGPKVQCAVIANILGQYMLGWVGPNRHNARREVANVMIELAIEMAEIEERPDDQPN
jgi:hypothetical protein